MTDDTMTRHDDRKAVVMIGHSYGSRSGWFADSFGDLTVVRVSPVWNPQQFMPDGHLKRRSLKIQWEIELRSMPLEVFRNLPKENPVRFFIADAALWNLASKMDRNESLIRWRPRSAPPTE